MKDIENIRFLYSQKGNKKKLAKIWEQIKDNPNIELMSEMKCIKAVNDDYGFTFSIPTNERTRITDGAYGFLLKVHNGFDVRSLVKLNSDIKIAKWENMTAYISRNGGPSSIFELITDNSIASAEST